MDNLWVTQIEENIATYIDAEINETADILVTTEDYTGDTASFPAVYVHELPQVERGYDIEGTSINGVLSTFQIEVYCNSRQECKETSNAVLSIMKDLRFEVTASPLYKSENGYTFSVARYRRLVGGEDLDLITRE